VFGTSVGSNICAAKENHAIILRVIVLSGYWSSWTSASSLYLTYWIQEWMQNQGPRIVKCGSKLREHGFWAARLRIKSGTSDKDQQAVILSSQLTITLRSWSS
jgi:hypothetical protein